MRSFLKIEIVIGTIVILCSLVLSLFAFRKENTLTHLRRFYLYPLLAFYLSTVTFTDEFIITFSKSTITIAQYIYIFLEPIFWGTFFMILFRNKKRIALIRTIFIITLSLITFLAIRSNFNSHNHQIVSISNLSFTFYCGIYFFDLFRGEPIKLIKSDPTFYIVVGLFFYSALSLPFFSLSDYFKRSNSFLYPMIICFLNLTIIIMHLFFIKGYLCLIKPTKV